MKKKIEDIYKDMDEITHILTRPGMWVGSTKEENKTMFLFSEETSLMELKSVSYIPAMLKIFDEVLSNSCDEFRRKTNLGLTKIEVLFNVGNGSIKITDNGGIPVLMHKKAKCYVPEFIFGRLRTSSNYNDDEKRNVVGMNGVGSALTNVFSSKFIIDTADGKNSYHRSWTENMRKLDDDMKIKPTKEHFTSTTFFIDFDKFECSKKAFTSDFILVCMKRSIDAAAANIGLTVNFKVCDDNSVSFDQTWKFKSFDEYIDLYSSFVSRSTLVSFNDLFSNIYIFPGNDNPIDIGFVNGAECSKGTHIEAIRNAISKRVRDFINHKEKIDIPQRSINKLFSVFCNMRIDNPTYNSQTKDELTTPKDKFIIESGFKFELPEIFLKKIESSELIPIVLDWNQKKEDADLKKLIRKANKESGKLIRNSKFINCNSRVKTDRQLWIFEGDSAAGGFRQGRNPQIQAAYLMRGVPLNTNKMDPVNIMKNEVFSDIINIIGLKWGIENKKKDLNFGKIVIASDMDYDGHKIAALLLVFFNHFPELFEQKMVCRIISPIIIASRKGERKNFFSLKEFRDAQSSLKGWNIKYIKGLGSQSEQEYREMMRSDNFIYFNKDNNTDIMLDKWFGKGIASVRKDMLKHDVEA